MEQFFTTAELDNKIFPLFSIHHLIPIFIILLLGALIVSNQEKLRYEKNRRTFMLCLGVLILIQQILLYSWYAASNINMLKDGLPFYLCRTGSICIVYSLISNKKSLNFIVFFIGYLGGVIALLSPDTSGYLFPHVMYVQFFITHGGMLLAALFLRVVDGYVPDRKELKKIIIYILVYSSFVSILNPLVNGNYGYLETPPKSAHFFSLLPSGLIYKFGITGVMCLLMSLVYIALNKKSIAHKNNFYRL
jgi:hypothetical integral membrane protein (TIGR02206 family)